MVIPLVAAVLVCLLATSGVWLITAEDGGDARDTTPIGLNVPTDAPRPVATDAPPGGGKGIQGGQQDPSASGSASPSASQTPTPSKTTKKPATSAPPSSAAPPPPSSAPPPPPPPPPTSAPPQKEYAVAADAAGRPSKTTLTISVQNPNATPRGPWTLTINGVDKAEVEQPPSTVAFSNQNTTATSGGTGPATTITLRLIIRWYWEGTIKYTFKDGTTEKTYTVQISRN